MVSLQQPTLAVTENLRWTRSGVVYAEWLLAAAPTATKTAPKKPGSPMNTVTSSPTLAPRS
ncbi:hypothetical protein I553_3864 [Mycobacterium xenopi 4042]|uniref:Uncharacterized protein n=1 Tax=Mycobacterium xenopi 4042 TaxID=1299334 RepID=X8APV8_MYCXE|nr:hypothetical protein I553_3544 [Mycobacterium xenopi 4042]EUA33083.1 hypothetical protein I553_3864 [Mycobacterium xenopi 4042]